MALTKAHYRMIDSGVVNVKDYGAVGDGVTNNADAFQAAVNYCVQNGKALYIPQGTYILGNTSVAGPAGGTGPVYLSNLTADYQGLTMFGDGRGKSILKSADGKTELNGRYDKMFYAWLDDPATSSYTFGQFTFVDLTFDKNARSNAFPASAYGYEQSHIIQFAGGTVPSVRGISFLRCEFLDKTAGCFTYGTSGTPVESISIVDCQSIHHPTAIQSGWGQRGCFELGCDTDLAVLDGVTALYSQIEPVQPSAVDRQRHYRIDNSRIDTLEYTDNGGYSFVDVSNTYCKNKLLNRGMQSNITNCVWVHRDYHTPVSMNVTNCKILLDYDADTDAVTSLYLTPPLFDTYDVTARFVNCSIEINSAVASTSSTSYGVRGAVNSSDGDDAIFEFSNCTFDQRLYGTFNQYSEGWGRWSFDNCHVAGQTKAFQAGTYSGYVHEMLKITDCDFSKVVGTWIDLGDASATFGLIFNGTYLSSDVLFAKSSGSAGYVSSYIGRPHLIGSAAPTTGYWFVGDRVYNSSPSAGGTEGWVCTAQGSPGTWKTFGTISV